MLNIADTTRDASFLRQAGDRRAHSTRGRLSRKSPSCLAYARDLAVDQGGVLAVIGVPNCLVHSVPPSRPFNLRTKASVSLLSRCPLNTPFVLPVT